MSTSQVALAAAAFAKGNYADALEIYKRLGQQFGEKVFAGNVKLCERRLCDLASRSAGKSPNISSLYANARHDFYEHGRITLTRLALEEIARSGHVFDKPQREFQAFVGGLARLRPGWGVPPRQPNTGHFARDRHLLYCLHQSLPHTTNGYSTRSHGVAVGLKNSGWKVRAVTRPGFPWDAGVAGLTAGYHQAEVDGIPYAALPGWNLKTTPLDQYLAQAADHYLREAQTSGAEIIVAASNHITALPALTAARRLGVPFVYELRGLWEVTQAATKPAWADSERYALMRSLEQQAAREADLIATITQELAEELVSWGVPRERIILVPNAVDAQRFTPAKPDAALVKALDLKLGVPVIGYAGSAVPYEGLELLLEALGLLHKQGEDFVFVLVGDGSAIDSIKTKALAAGLEKHCRFVGRIAFDQVPRYLSCMDILPVPRLSSAVTEMVSALKPLEAMAMGKAVVLSDVSPHKIMAGDNARAQLFRKDDAGDLARVLKKLMHDPTERERLGKAARAWVEKERTWDSVTRVYDQALRGLRSAKKAAAPFAKGNYAEALEINKSLGQQLGEEFFEANIKLCEGRLQTDTTCIKKQENNFQLQNRKVTFSEFAESYIQLARSLANKQQTLSETIKGRIAVVAGAHSSKGIACYRSRLQKLTQCFLSVGWEVFLIVSPPLTSREIHNSIIDKTVNGVRCLHGQWPMNSIPTSPEAILTTTIEIFAGWFKTYKPDIVLAADDFVSALPAIVAARQLSLPVIKEHLHYAEVFKGTQTQGIFECLDFSERFALDQACNDLANGSFYHHEENPGNANEIPYLVQKVCKKGLAEKPLATLMPQKQFTMKERVQGEGLYYLELDVEDAYSGSPKGIVASFRFLDNNGKNLIIKLPEFSSSNKYPQYKYIDTCDKSSNSRALVFNLPASVAELEVDIVAFNVKKTLILRLVKIGKVNLGSVARWLSLRCPGGTWINAVKDFVHKKGAVSLRLALLHYNYLIDKKTTSKIILEGAVQEMIELDRDWLPELLCRTKKLSINVPCKLTVAHLHKTAYPYENTGGSIRCLNTVISQKREGLDAYVITPIGYPISSNIANAKNYEVIEGVEHFRIGSNTDGLRGISIPDCNRYSVFYIAKLLKKRGASVIHAASGVRGYELALQGLALKKLTGLPLLYEVRSFHEHTWSRVSNDVMDLEKTQLRLIKENFCMEQVDCVTTISESMKKILIERGISPDKIEVIPNAIDETKYISHNFKPISIPALRGAEFVVGYISNMSLREGHQYLIRAIHQLRRQTGRDIRGLLVGNGPEKNNLEDLVTELGMREVIVFPGEIDHSQINAYYKAIDLFVVPRIPDYAADWVTPLKPYEAMALDRPLIVSNLPALIEIVGANQERGLIAKSSDVNSICEQINRFINDPVLRKSKVNTAKKWVFAERTWSANTKRYKEIYRRLIEQNHIGRNGAQHD